MRILSAVLAGCLLLPGCLPMQLLDPYGKENQTILVPNNPFGNTVATMKPIKVNYAPGNAKQALRVQKIGSEILTANPEIGMKPHFGIYGTENPELFHTTHMVHITEGLVKKCQSDGELAALLALELAEMVVEREALAHPKMRKAEIRPPAEVLIGNGISDRDPANVRLAELARHDKQAKQKEHRSLALPDPNKLAERYLEKSGYDKSELEAAAPLFQLAERTYILEKQYKQANSMMKWNAGTPSPAEVAPKVPSAQPKMNYWLPGMPPVAPKALPPLPPGGLNQPMLLPPPDGGQATGK